jgi:chromosome segregation ATPase
LSDNDHWHYASDIHGGAEQHHRHHDLEREDETAQRDIRRLQEDVRELRSLLDSALDRISELEAATPEAQQAEYEADVAVADLAASGYDDDRPDLEEYNPGPECDDEGGMSEYRYVLPEDYGRGQS